MLLIGIMDKGAVPCSTDTHISDNDYLFKRLLSAIFDKHIVCHECGLRYPEFEPSTVLYVTPTGNASMHEVALWEYKQKLCKTCPCCKEETCHVECKHILQPPKYLIISANRFSHMDNMMIKIRSLIPLDPNIVLAPYQLYLQSTSNQHGLFMNCGHYTDSINCCGKKLSL